MDETLEQLVAQFGNPAELTVKIGREKAWPLREGKVVSPQWIEKLGTALNEPDQLKGTVSVSRGTETVYKVSSGTVDIDEREALEELTQLESLPEQAEPEVQPAYLDLLNSRLERVGESKTLDELRTDVEQSRATSGMAFVNTFDDIVIREGLEQNLSREQTLAVLEQSPTLEGLSSEDVARYRTQFENQYNSESARFSGIVAEPETEAAVVQADVIEPEQVVYPGLDADYIPNVEPEQTAAPEPLVAREPITAEQLESLNNSFYGQTIDAHQQKFDRPLLNEMTVWSDQNHDALFTNAALDQRLSVEQFQEGLSQSPNIQSQADAAQIAPMVASYGAQLEAQQTYSAGLSAYYEANPTQWQERNTSLPALTDSAQYPDFAAEMDQKFTQGAKLLDMPPAQYEQAISNSPYVRLQLADRVPIEDVARDYIAPKTTAYESERTTQRSAEIPVELEPVTLEPELETVTTADLEDVTGLPENLPEDEDLRQDEGITEPVEFNEEEDMQPEDSALPTEDLESFNVESESPIESEPEAVVEQADEVELDTQSQPEQVVYPSLDAEDYKPSELPAIDEYALPSELVDDVGMPQDLSYYMDVAEQAMSSEPAAELTTAPEPESAVVAPGVTELSPALAVQAATAEQVTEPSQSFYGQTIDAYQAKFDRPLLNQMTVRPDQNHDALFTDAALDQGLSVEQFQEGLSQSPHILSQVDVAQSPDAVADHIAPIVASYDAQLQAQQTYSAGLSAYYDANPTQWSQRDMSLPALTDSAQYPHIAAEMDQHFTQGAMLLDMPSAQYEQAISHSPYVRLQLAERVPIEDVARDYIAPITASYEGDPTTQVDAEMSAELELVPPEPKLEQSTAEFDSPYLNLVERPNTQEEYTRLYEVFMNSPEQGVAADLVAQESALSQGMAADDFLRTVTSGPYVQGLLDDGTPITDLNTVYLSQVMTSYLDEQQALKHSQTVAVETAQIDPVEASSPELAETNAQIETPLAAVASDSRDEFPLDAEVEAWTDKSVAADPIQQLDNPSELAAETAPVSEAFATTEPISEPASVIESVPVSQTVDQSITTDIPQSSSVQQFTEDINQPLNVPLDREAQQAALAQHFDFPSDALHRTDVVNGVLATAEPRLESLQAGFSAVEFELKNLAQHINEGKFNDWSSTQGQRVKTAAQTMTESVKGRFSQWVDNAKLSAKTKVSNLGHTIKDKFDKAIALVDSDKLERVAPILPSQVDGYKIDNAQGLRIERDGIPVYENGKYLLGINSRDVVFMNQLPHRAEKQVSSMVEGLANRGGELQPNGDRSFSVGTYTMTHSQDGAVKLHEASRGNILHAQDGKITSALNTEDFSRFNKFQQNVQAQVAVKAPVMAQAKGGIEVG